MPSEKYVNERMRQIVTAKEVFYSQMLVLHVWQLPPTDSGVPKASALMIYLYSQAIRQINDKLSQANEVACSDSMILAVMYLYFVSTHPLDLFARNGGAVRRDSHRTTRPDLHQGPLNDLRALRLGGGHVDAGNEHRKGLERMIELRGGVKAIQAPGIAQSYC
jgi:hypothetical protein